MDIEVIQSNCEAVLEIDNTDSVFKKEPHYALT